MQKPTRRRRMEWPRSRGRCPPGGRSSTSSAASAVQGVTGKLRQYLQGDHSGCVKPPVDTETKVAFYNMGHILKRNFCCAVNGRFEST